MVRLTEDKAERHTEVDDAEARHVARQHLVKDDDVGTDGVERPAVSAESNALTDMQRNIARSRRTVVLQHKMVQYMATVLICVRHNKRSKKVCCSSRGCNMKTNEHIIESSANRSNTLHVEVLLSKR